MRFIIVLLLLSSSLQVSAVQMACDTNEVNNLNDRILDLIYDEPRKGLELAQRNELQAKRCGYKIGQIRALIRQGIAYELLAQKSKAIESYQKSIVICKEAKYQKGLASCYNNIGLIYWNESKYRLALEYYLKSFEIFEKNKNYYELGNVANNIGLIHLEIFNNDKAEFWFKKSINYYKKTDAKSEIYNLYTNLSILMEKENKDSVQYYFDLAYNGFKKENDLFGLVILKNHETVGYLNQKEFQKALKSSEAARTMALEIENDLSYLTASIDYINARIELGMNPLSETELLELLELAKNYDNARFLSVIYGQLSILKISQGKLLESNEYGKLSVAEANRYIVMKQDENTAKMQAIYEVSEQKLKSETLEKEKFSILKEKEAEQRLFRIWVWGSILFLILIVSIFVLFLSRRNLKNRLHKEREVYSAKTDERKRISYDLHDNLGSQLSFLVNNLEILQNEIPNTERIMTSYKMAQEAMLSLRDSIWMLHQNKVKLSDFEVKIKQLNNDILSNFGIEAVANFEYAEDLELDAELVFNLLKIYKEIINNTIKHANAKRFEVDFIQSNSDFIIRSKDDGKGCDLSKTSIEKYGLLSISERVKKINGSVNFESQLGAGFQVHILINKAFA